MNILLIGAGYIGGTVLSYLSSNYRVHVLDPAFADIGYVNHSEADIDALLNAHTSNIDLYNSPSDLPIKKFGLSIICLPTNWSSHSSALDINIYQEVFKQIVECQISIQNTIIRSTLDVDSFPSILNILDTNNFRTNLIYFPEFLREGSAYSDLIDPHISIIGGQLSGISTKQLSSFIPINFNNLHIVPINMAILAKMSFNAWRALKVSVANEIMRLCSSLNIDSNEFANLFISDTAQNIGKAYLKPGYSYGGPCLPKDTMAFASLFARNSIASPLFSAVNDSNASHVNFISKLILKHLSSVSSNSIAFDSLEFKRNTMDLRNSQFVDIALSLLDSGISVYVPKEEFLEFLGLVPKKHSSSIFSWPPVSDLHLYEFFPGRVSEQNIFLSRFNLNDLFHF